METTTGLTADEIRDIRHAPIVAVAYMMGMFGLAISMSGKLLLKRQGQSSELTMVHSWMQLIRCLDSFLTITPINS